MSNETNETRFPEGVTFEIRCEQEDIPVRGHFATGDDEQDREIEDTILADLDAGNPWAWCYVVVEASYTSPEGDTFTGRDGLGCCSYQDEADFKAGGYYEDMQREAFEDLKRTMRIAASRGSSARLSLEGFETPDDRNDDNA